LRRSGEVDGMVAIAVVEQISPELVLVDPKLAAVERPRERSVSVPVRQVVPIGVPLLPREAPAARPRWFVAAAGLCLLASGLVLSIGLFRGPSGDSNRPTAVVSTRTVPGVSDRFVGPPIPNP
jgi:hypothetical protein